ncbi:leukocyte receptor cluster member 8, partial [Thraustotheca clavata]
MSHPPHPAAPFSGVPTMYVNAPRGVPIRPPPPRGGPFPVQYSYQQAPIPPPATSRWDRAPQDANQNQWQWSNGHEAANRFGPGKEVVSAPPKMYTPSPPAVSKFSTQPPPSAQPSSTGSTTQWPPSLKAYVQHAFNSARSEGDKVRVQTILKEKISSAITANQLWSKNWTVEPLPLQNPPPVPPPHLRPPPPRPHAGMPPPRHPMVPPPRHIVPPPRPSGFIPLESARPKSNKRKLDDDPDGHDVSRKLQRQQRFLKDSFSANKVRAPMVDNSRPLQVLNDEGELDLEAMVIKGTCTVVEKEYLRLTSAPHPSTVRPQSILAKALEMVRKKWKKGKCDYIYACSQMKSIRQDCTVQHIKNEFTVLVYETHGRIALEEGDMNEFNQCQTQLHMLYDSGLTGSNLEFLAYRILYCIYVCLQAKADVNTGNLAMAKVLSKVTPSDRMDEAVSHALDVREAIALNNYAFFFHLYSAAPKMSGYIMDAYVDHVRLQALRIMCKAYMPSIPLRYVKEMFKLEGKEGDDFVAESGIVFVDDKAEDLMIDAKASDIVTVRSGAKSL